MALEGALNLIFHPSVMNNTPTSYEDDLCWDAIEESAVNAAVNLIQNYCDGSVFGVRPTEDEIVQEVWDNMYLNQTVEIESQFMKLVEKLAEDITDDHYNPDVNTLYGEMSMRTRLIVRSYAYYTDTGVLRLAIQCL